MVTLIQRCFSHPSKCREGPMLLNISSYWECGPCRTGLCLIAEVMGEVSDWGDSISSQMGKKRPKKKGGGAWDVQQDISPPGSYLPVVGIPFFPMKSMGNYFRVVNLYLPVMLCLRYKMKGNSQLFGTFKICSLVSTNLKVAKKEGFVVWRAKWRILVPSPPPSMNIGHSTCTNILVIIFSYQ